jgi:hypothetical protein
MLRQTRPVRASAELSHSRLRDRSGRMPLPWMSQADGHLYVVDGGEERAIQAQRDTRPQMVLRCCSGRVTGTSTLQLLPAREVALGRLARHQIIRRELRHP